MNEITLDHIRQACVWAQAPTPINGVEREYIQTTWDCGTACCLWGAAGLIAGNGPMDRGPSVSWCKQSTLHTLVAGLLHSSCTTPQQMAALLSRADLFGADLSRADLFGADLSRADLSGANLSGANLSDADLSGADLSGANLSDADLSDADLSGANLSDADLSDADLSGADLSRAVLSGASLFHASLSGANLSGANLFGANLSGARFRAGWKIVREEANP